MIDFVIDSYNQLLDQLQNIIQNYDFKKQFKDQKKNNIELSFNIISIDFDKDSIKDSILILRQRQQNFSIKINIRLEVILQLYNKGTKSLQHKFPIDNFYLELPLVTNCKYDPYLYKTTKQRYLNGDDLTAPGGDIIFSGVPYLVQNTLSYPFNKPIIAPSDKDNQILFANYLYQNNVIFGNSYYTTYSLLKIDNQLDIVMNYKQSDSRTKQGQIPLLLLFRAYGLQTCREALEFCNPTNDTNFNFFLIDIFRNGPIHKELMPKMNISTQDAKKQIASIIGAQNIPVEQVMSALEKYISEFKNAQSLFYQLGEITRGIYNAYSKGQFSNRDSLHNKRVRMIGQQILQELRENLKISFFQSMFSLVPEFKKINYEELDTDKMTQLLNEALQNMSQICSSNLIKSFVNSSFDLVAPLQKTLNEQKNIILDILQKRQIVIRAESMGGRVNWSQRKQYNDYYGFICPVQTPESGAATGRYQSIGIYSYVSQITDPQPIIDFIKKSKYYLADYKQYTMPIKVNYNTIGFVKFSDFKMLYNQLMDYRKKNSLFDVKKGGNIKKNDDDKDTIKNTNKETNKENNIKETTTQQDIPQQDTFYYKSNSITKRANQLFISIYYNIENTELGIWTDAGRIMTPIIKGKYTGNQTLSQMIESGKIIYICPDMADNFIIKNYDEVKPTEWAFLPEGALSEFPSTSPFSGCQKAIRALYSSAQMKQNISIPFTNTSSQMTNQQLTMSQPQYNHIDTSFGRTLFQQKPMQQLVFLCIKPYTFNQEDAIVANQGYFYRNGSSTNSYKTFITECDQNEKIITPKNSKKEIGQQLHFDDLLTTKEITDINNETTTKKITYDLKYPCKYTQISSIKKEQLENEYIIQTQLERYPAEGDKFVSRNAQKGTIGRAYLEYQLDILDSGIVPTFFGNPAGIMKRETYGQILEPAIGYYLSQSKQYTLDYGHDQYDKELLIEVSKQKGLDGYSKYGNKLNMPLLGGTIMYSVQKHLIAQKVYAINKPAQNKVTRQPAQGRKRHGGMRIGNLEQSAFFAQGISEIIKDQAGLNSSQSIWYICKSCGCNQVYRLKDKFIQTQTNQQFQYYCPRCGYTNNVQEMGNSYQQTLLQGILDSLGIQMIYDYK